MHPEHLSITDFTYHLPPEKIAQAPLAERDQSKLLIYNDGEIAEDVFASIPQHLPSGSLLIFNDTKVIHARLIFKNAHGASIEVFLLSPEAPHRDMQLAIFQHGSCTWRCMVGNAKKWREETLSLKLKTDDGDGLFTVKITGKADDDFLIHFSWTPEHLPFIKVIEAAGFVPLPPYIKRNTVEDDEQRYQTLYAVQDGSVAAPTAGLHFTEKIFKGLKEKGIQTDFVTLHVSAGTFLPVKAATTAGHRMHAEQIVIRRETLEHLLAADGRKVICVGTTSMRTVESIYWLGRSVVAGDHSMTVGQWDPYDETPPACSAREALAALLGYMQEQRMSRLVAETRLLIAPGYTFKFAHGLITNFHLPGSTLLLLVAAFVGNNWRQVYRHALDHHFRFLSYGDGSLLWSKE